MSKRVLIACEESQTELEAFLEAGCDAWSCDIKPCSGKYPERHIQGDALKLIDVPFDLIIAHPPCTYLSSVTAPLLFDKDHSCKDWGRFRKLVEARAFFMKFFEFNSPRIAIENPTPLKVANLPPYTQIIHPYMFGSVYAKRTAYWLQGLPALTPTVDYSNIRPISFHDTRSGSEARSKGFREIADAMVTQWGGLLG